MNKTLQFLQVAPAKCRWISTTTSNYSKRNFDKFPLYEKRLSPLQRAILRTQKGRKAHPDIVKFIDRGIRPTKMLNEVTNVYETVPEMIPDIIVPDLTGFELKPYVTYRAPDVEQSAFSPQDLFQAVYSQKIVKDFEEGKLDDEGNSLEPSSDEMLTCEEAKNNARKTGSDLFLQNYHPAPKV